MKSMCKCVEQGANDDRPYGIDVGKGTSWAPSPTHTNAKKGRPMVAPTNYWMPHTQKRATDGRP